MLDYRWRRLLSGFLALVLVVGMLPPAAVETEATEVVEVLETEPVTTEPVETTVATEAVEETEAPEEAVPETTAETTEETVAETTEFVLPENVAAVQALIDALPTVDTVTAEDYDAVQEAYDAYEALSDEEKALIHGAEVFESLFGCFNTQTATLEDNTCGDNLTWTLADGTLTISGTGEMTDYSYDGAPWYSKRSSITTVIIEEGVTSIGNYAFSACTWLSSITIPEGITSIGNETFFCCSSLTSITIPKGVTSIGDTVFYECNDLTSVTIPDTVTSIGENVFYGCESLTGITIPESVVTIGAHAFYGCSSLTSITIPEGVTSIGDYAFCECDSLTSVTIPWSVTYIGGYAFWCEALAEIHFTHRSWDTLEIEDDAFWTNETYRKLTLFVPNLNDIPEAVSGYDWSANHQQITYRAEGFRPVTGIALTQAEETVKAEVGEPIACKIQTTPAGTTSDILWSIIPGTGTAAVTQSGVVTGITAGIVTVRVTSAEDDNVFAELPLTILPPTGGEPTAITVTTGGLYENEVAVGQTIPMIATFTPANASNRNVTWEVQNGTGTARINQQGNLTGLTPGAVTVYATTDNGPENSCTVNVVRYAESIQIFLDGKSDTTSMGVGETKYLTAVLTPENTTTTEVEWGIIRGTGAAELSTSYQYDSNGNKIQVARITGTEAGTVTVVATAKDSHAVVAKAELEITDTIRAYAVTGGNIYYNTETGWITAVTAR